MALGLWLNKFETVSGRSELAAFHMTLAEFRVRHWLKGRILFFTNRLFVSSNLRGLKLIFRIAFLCWRSIACRCVFGA